ncbi:MAG TPA: hypothetical protein VFR34_00095 [Paracoccaceae bacterium]|nr:hypothetical protein [Paracoccaceae bacterium]
MLRCCRASGLMLIALVACAPVPGTGIMQVQAISEKRVLVGAGGASVNVVPPEGFCVAADSVKTSSQSVFVLIGGCGNAETAELLTASVSSAPLFAAGSAPDEDLDRLEEFVGSEHGLALVSRSGEAGKLRILETHREGEALILFVEDSGQPIIPNASPRFWRAFLELGGRMVSLSASTFNDRPTEERTMLSLLRRFIAALRQANPAAPAALPLAG